MVGRKRLSIACAALVTTLPGCAAYEPMPLDGGSVDQALAPPGNAAALTARAAELRHPLLPAVAIDPAGGLTPDAAAVLAVVANPALRAVRDGRAVASAQLLKAGLLPNPTLDFSLDPVTGGNTADTVTGYNVGLSWDLTAALVTREATVAAARAEVESVRLDVAWQEWQYAQAAKKAVYDVIALSAQRDEAAAVDRRLAENVELVRRAVEARQRTLLDLSAAEAASQKARADRLAAEAELRRQRLVLNQALGLPPEAEPRLRGGDVAPVLPSRLDLPPDAELTGGLVERRLDLLALRHGYESQEQTLRAAVLAQFPKVVLGFHQASDTSNVHTTGFGVSVDLPIFDRNQGAIAAETATRQKLFDEYVARLFEARAAVAQALSDARSLAEQIAAAEQAVPALARLADVYRQAAEQRNVDVISYYAVQNDLAQKRIDLLKLKQQLADTKVALELASGRYLPDGGGPATRPATRQEVSR